MSKSNLNSSNVPVTDDEIDLREIFRVIWEGRWLVITLTTVVSALAVLYALNQPNIYKAEALLTASEKEPVSGLSSLSGQFGSLASLAGVNLGGNGGGNKTQLALEILKSRKFTTDFIKAHNILPDLMAVKSWDRLDDIIYYNEAIYDKSKNNWIREVEAPYKPEPSMQEAYKKFREHLVAYMDKESGMITISIEHMSPVVAQRWVNWLIEDINSVMKSRDVEEAIKSTEFLTSQLEQTQITDIRAVLYKLIEEQTKTIMFANVRDEYVFKTIDPALVPEQKFKPKRPLICIFGFLLGGILSVVTVLTRYFLRKER
ncbi:MULTISPECIES: Wzz/FepE/Etk N-terminal domain-containing protein [unclassified Pseudoalteromonas]|uniref:Wzz/FepE/Etk N-terminal domain-containing protein n=1 Tax=unclassified Pseudoalteromonas TaxID=194690 RepID=UPI0015F5C142|nr:MULTISPECIES: Wzz/FepE/Etk N-terminal domain-containing protein [unclassified Pseudoalteromonas]MBA6409098.1 LPS O-antigen length regulator [Pseudoalteromonas sp. 5Ae-yellow]MDN3389510.1 Wzz/FepE/Etk N-terminal domain-containing protein [Pseudoalteromonas sp. APC 3691]